MIGNNLKWDESALRAMDRFGSSFALIKNKKCGDCDKG
jgi:hypothetical protein